MSAPPPADEIAPRERGEAPVRQEGALMRWLALIVLLPTVPMLLASVAALALFYLAPTRFGSLLSRLPGDDLIRSVLVFAPATLLAIVVLAFLYAVERPAEAASSEAREAEAPRPRTPWTVPRAARLALTLAIPALFLAIAVSVLGFVAPARFAALIERLPAPSYLWKGVRAAPAIAFAVVLAATSLALLGSHSPGGRGVRRDLMRLSVGLILLPTVPLFLLSVGALGLFLLSPGRFASLAARLPEEATLRLALLAAPAILVVVLLLALLYLWEGRAGGGEAFRPPAAPPSRRGLPDLSPALGVWVLVGGLVLTAALGIGLLGVLFLLVVV